MVSSFSGDSRSGDSYIVRRGKLRSVESGVERCELRSGTSGVGEEMTQEKNKRTKELANDWGNGRIEMQHKYQFVTFREVDGVVRVFDKNGEMMPMEKTPRKAKNRAW